jgi:hypothetical protein
MKTGSNLFGTARKLLRQMLAPQAQFREGQALAYVC